MRLLLTLFLLSCLCLAQSWHANPSTEGTLVRAEKLTPTEKAKLQAADMEVSKAQSYLESVRQEIAEDHKMSFPFMPQSIGEESWFEFDGDWILSRHRYFITLTGGALYTPSSK